MTQNTITPAKFDYDIEPLFNFTDMSNKLFCTFSSEEQLEEVLSTIQGKYKIIYNKIFVLYSKSQDEYICTYNVDFGNISNFIDNTILVHRKKESNTLYTINALNTLIRSLNNGFSDLNFKVTWSDYSNCLLLIQNDVLKRIDLKIDEIIYLT